MQTRGILTDELKQRVYMWYLEGHRVADIAACVRCSKNVIYRALREFPPVPQKSLGYYSHGVPKGKQIVDICKEIERLESDGKKLKRLYKVLQEAVHKGGDASREIMRIWDDIETTERELQALYKAYNEQVS